MQKQRIVDIPQTEDIDYSFVNSKNDLLSSSHNSSLSQDVDFSFFNDPFAFACFDKPLLKAKLTGYIEYAFWWANRKGIGDGDVFEILFPDKRIFDANCKDLNAVGSAEMQILDTRLRFELFGPHLLGASTFMFVESDVFGFEATELQFRIWHALIQFSWQRHQLLLGQFWHPFSVVNTFPITVTVDNGSPITPNSRNPQIRYSIIHGNKEFLFAMLTQHQFPNDGPEGPNSIYLRNSRVPILAARMLYNDKSRIYAGAGIVFQRLVPRIESDKGYRIHESINSVQATLFATLRFAPLEIRQQLVFAQNANNLNMLGGFAVTEIDPINDMRHYTNTNTLGYWIDININRKIEPGLFLGIVKNFGARTNIIQCTHDPETDEETSTIYGLGMDISSVVKCYPRIRFHILPIDFAFEFEITRATYGCINNKAKIRNIDPVTHIRIMFASYYYF